MKLSDLARNRAIDAVCALLNGGVLRLYDSRGVELAELSFSNPAFDAADDGSASARKIGDDPQAKNDGIAVEYRAFTPQGAQVLSGTVKEYLQVRKNVIIGLDEFTYKQESQ